MSLPSVQDARAAHTALRGQVRRTPVLRSDALDAAVEVPIVAKAESLQVTGSFKVRGALNRLRTLTREQLDAGLITVSAGNAALGAAHAAHVFGAALTVVMPENAVPEKLAAVAAYGGVVVVKDGVTSSALAFERAAALQAEQHLTFVHPFDDPMVIAGAATATMELLEDQPTIGRLLVPCSGGGLVSGAILAVAAFGADVEIVGVQPIGSDGLVRSLAAGTPTQVPDVSTVADGLTAAKPGGINFEMVRAAGIRVVTVTDDDILAALALLVRHLKLVVEPAAAVGLAALISGVVPVGGVSSDRETALLLSGGNINMSLLRDVLDR